MSNIKESLVRCGAILYGDFTLSSGKKSKYYIDIKKASTDPKILEEVADEMAHIIENDDIDVDRIAGVVLGSVPLAVALSLRTGIPFIMIRKEPKDHGTGKLIEGSLDKGMKVLVIEDVVTSAGSAAYAIEVLRKTGADVEHVLSVVDREEGGKERLESMSTKLHALGHSQRCLEAELMKLDLRCDRCLLCSGRNNVVGPSGDLDSKLVFVGEAPGATEDRIGKPFVGKAGKMLDRLLAENGFPREKIMRTNAVRCRPPNNRRPTREEVKGLLALSNRGPSGTMPCGSARPHGLRRVARPQGLAKGRRKQDFPS